MGTLCLGIWLFLTGLQTFYPLPLGMFMPVLAMVGGVLILVGR